MIVKGLSINGGYNKNQLAYLGIDWPPVKGWKKQIIGNDIDKITYDKFINEINNHVVG